ncbi:MAG: extracellular solute-binding protein [Clostridiales bacterium]|jgi:multiple sugar transport system substrate-binding protein|nr:extracellular solute-binding protein [Clostridiales bacterium]
MSFKKMICIVLVLCLSVTVFAGCNVNVNPDAPAETASEGETADTFDPDANVADTLEALVESTPGGVQGGPVEAPKVEGIQYDAKYQRDLNIEPGSYAGKTISVWTFWDMPETDIEIYKNFEELTGAKIEYVNKLYESYSADLIKAIAAGEGPDICYFGSEAIPAYAKKGYLLPVSDYMDVSKVAFPTNQSDINFYTFNGKLYVMPDGGNPATSRMYFRKDIFANASLPNPYELYLQGEWTWDKFVELAQDIKQDVDGDGQFDIWGYYSWQQEQILYSNGANYVQWVDGAPVEGLSDPKAIRALEWERALSEQYEIIAPWDPDADPTGMLIKGSIAMTYWGDWLLYGEEGLRAVLGDKLGLAPFPKGPDATNPFGDAASGHKEGLAGSSKEPELAALFLLYKRLPADEVAEAEAKTKKEADALKDFGSIEEYEMCLEMGNNAVINPCGGFTGLQEVIDAIRGKTDMTPAQAVETYKQVAQKRIDETWNQ